MLTCVKFGLSCENLCFSYDNYGKNELEFEKVSPFHFTNTNAPQNKKGEDFYGNTTAGTD